MTGLRDLVALLYRADWTQLSLSGELVTRTDQAARGPLLASTAGATTSPDTQSPPRWRETSSSVLVAAGGRFRVENQASDDHRDITLCDGESCWRLSGDWAARRDACLGDPVLAQLLDPSWLLVLYDLAETGTIETGGRAVYCVTATPRPLGQRGGRPDRIDVLVDAELGILLHLETRYGGRLVETVALEPVTMRPDPAPDLTQFSPPPGTTPTDPGSAFAEFGQLKGPFGQMASTAADLTVNALGFAIKHAPRPAEAPPGPPMPIPAPEAESVPDESLANDVINWLYRTGLPGQAFTAEVRQWTDTEVMLERWQRLRSAMPQPVTGLFGPDALWTALGERAPGLAYRTARLRIAAPGQYRLDYLSGDWHAKLAVACDGQHLQTRYRNRVVTGPAKPLKNDWARLADPAWLLLSDWRLSPAAETTVGGRPGLLAWADIQPAPEPSVLFEVGWYRPRRGLTFDRVAVVIDTELGILLRLVGYFDGLAACFELHEVEQLSAADPAEFTLEIPPGTRVVESSSPLAHLDMQGPVKAAKAAGQLGLAGAAALSGWLQNRPRKHEPPDRDQ